MRDHIIVCGDDALAKRIIGELRDDELSVVALNSAPELEAAGVAAAHAVIAASPDDSVNLEVALLARQANPAVRVVARLANSVLHQAMRDSIGDGAVLDVADLAAPSVVEALLGRTAHTIRAAGVDFVVATDSAPRDGTLREIYGRLAPVAVIRGDHAAQPGEVIACPHLDDEVRLGDSITIMGRAEELSAQGLQVGVDGGGPWHRSPPVRAFDGARAFLEDLNPMFYRALGIAVAMLVGSRCPSPPRRSPPSATAISTSSVRRCGFGCGAW
jgi:Trk K+ transport system NAD-binding subunit